MVATAQGHAAWGRLALAGGLLHVWNHGLFKALLFLGAGSVLHATGTREMSRLGGLWRAMPWTAGLFALGAAAISGLPPLNGFVSEWLVYLGLFDATHLAAAPSALGGDSGGVLLAMTGALALACFVKVCGVVFLGAPRSRRPRTRTNAARAMRGADAGAGGGVCGDRPGARRLLAGRVARGGRVAARRGRMRERRHRSSTLGRVHVALAVSAVRGRLAAGGGRTATGWARALTWDCGYAAPTARMQYTAGSFAGIITEWFAWILRPERHEHRPEDVFPRRRGLRRAHAGNRAGAGHRAGGRFVMRVSAAARRLQHGRVQAYMLYLIIGLAALAAVVLAGTSEARHARRGDMQPILTSHVSESHPDRRVVRRFGKSRGRLDPRRRAAAHAGSRAAVV